MNASVDLDLIKATGKAGLVQVQRQVSRNGKTFTQNFWVRPGDVKSTDMVVGQPSPTAQQPKAKPEPKGNSGKKAMVDLLSTHGRDALMAHAKAAGITWKENDNPGINWMRASMAIQKHIASNPSTWDSGKIGASTQPKDVQQASTQATSKTTQSAQPAQPTQQAKQQAAPAQSTPKLNTQQPAGGDPKAKVKSLAETMGKDQLMAAAKAAGITWKENANPGINWMRAAMAMSTALKSNPGALDGAQGAQPSQPDPAAQAQSAATQASKDAKAAQKVAQDAQKQVKQLQDLVSQMQAKQAAQATAQGVAAQQKQSAFLDGLTTDFKSKDEQEKFGGALSKATPEQFMQARTLGMCADDPASLEYLSRMYNSYSKIMQTGANKGSSGSGRVLYDKLQGLVTAPTIKTLKSTLRNARKLLSRNVDSNYTQIQGDLLDPWWDPNTGERESGEFSLMKKLLANMGGTTEYGALAEDYLKTLEEYEKATQNNPMIQSFLAEVLRGNRWVDPNSIIGFFKYEDDIARIRSEGNPDYKPSPFLSGPQRDFWTDPDNFPKLQEAADIRKKLFSSKYAAINANLSVARAMGSRFNSQWGTVPRDFGSNFPVLSNKDLDKLEVGDVSALTDLALQMGIFNPKYSKKGKNAERALYDKWEERKAILEAYGIPDGQVNSQGDYIEDNEIKCKVSQVSGDMLKQITDKITADWDMKVHGRIKYKIHGVYEVSGLASETDFKKIQQAHSAYATTTSDGKNCQSDLFYHGTGSMATTLILGHTGGFRVGKAKCGRMLGDGVYLADKSSKSAQYVSDAGFSRANSRGSLMIVEASLGSVYDNKFIGNFAEQSQWKSHDTVFGLGTQGRDALYNNEWCVRDVKAVIPKYLIDIELENVN